MTSTLSWTTYLRSMNLIEEGAENLSQAVVHIHQKPKSTQKGKKRTFSALKDEEDAEAGDLDRFKDEEALDMLDDPHAAANGDDGKDQIQDSDVDMEVAVRSTTSMSVDVSGKQTVTKRVKTEEATSKAASINLRKVKPRNAHIPDDMVKSWRATFFPALMYWVGNSNYAWTIPEEDLCNALYEICSCIGGKDRGMREFEVGSYGYELAVQKTHEWMASFGSTAITVLMAFFTSNPEIHASSTRTPRAKTILEHFYWSFSCIPLLCI
ncbi:hypothetical protein BDR07DRAFT_138420 [Suillus spraguei]|nr:hypothetical protein BDR07DRAFT_138420 [Suillus spraguei]